MLLELVMNFNFEGFVKEIYRLRTLLGVKEFIFEVTIPLLREVGECVVKGELSITHEHIVSTIIRGQLNELKSPIDMFVKSKESFHMLWPLLREIFMNSLFLSLISYVV